MPIRCEAYVTGSYPVAVVLFVFALALCAARLAVLAGIFTRKLPRQTIDARSQSILLIDLFAAYVIGKELAHVTHSSLAWVITWAFCVAYIVTIAIRFAYNFKQEYRPTTMELLVYALAQVALVLAYIIAL